MSTLVLLPGLDGTGRMFAPFTDALPDLAVRVVDYPPDREMDYAQHEAHVRAHLPTDDFVLLAESFSGPIGISIAASAPPNLKGLILCATFASNPLPIFGPFSRLVGLLPAAQIPPRMFAPWLYAGRSDRELRRLHAQAMALVLPRTLRARVAAILKVDQRALLRRIAIPMLYLRATRDRLIPESALHAIQRVRPEIEVAEFDAPHFLLQTEPYRCAAAVMRFVHQIDGVPMEEERPDPPLDVQQSLRVSKLTQAELQEMDSELLAQASNSWRKVARIVGMTIGVMRARIPDVPDIYYAQRVQNLVANGKLESQGNLAFMRFSEVRLPRR